MINEKQANEWLESPVTKQFFKDIEIRMDELDVRCLRDNPEDMFRIGWMLEGGVQELARLLETTVADLVTEKEAA